MCPFVNALYGCEFHYFRKRKYEAGDIKWFWIWPIWDVLYAQYTWLCEMKKIPGWKIHGIFVCVWLFLRKNNYQVCLRFEFKTSPKWNGFKKQRFCGGTFSSAFFVKSIRGIAKRSLGFNRCSCCILLLISQNVKSIFTRGYTLMLQAYYKNCPSTGIQLEFLIPYKSTSNANKLPHATHEINLIYLCILFRIHALWRLFYFYGNNSLSLNNF